MDKEINNPMGTQTLDNQPVESPSSLDSGQEDIGQVIETEQADLGTDKAEVTPETYKSLQAEFTKKSQRLAEIERQREKELEELSTYRQMYAQQPQQKTAKDFAQMSEMEKFNYLVDERIGETVKPYISKIAQLEGVLSNIIMENASKIRSNFFEVNPDAAKYEDQIATLMTKHSIADPNKAWNFLKVELGLVKNEAKQEVIKEIQVKKDASKLMKPVSTPSTPISEKPKTFDEAYEQSLKELGMK